MCDVARQRERKPIWVECVERRGGRGEDSLGGKQSLKGLRRHSKGFGLHSVVMENENLHFERIHPASWLMQPVEHWMEGRWRDRLVAQCPGSPNKSPSNWKGKHVRYNEEPRAVSQHLNQVLKFSISKWGNKPTHSECGTFYSVAILNLTKIQCCKKNGDNYKIRYKRDITIKCNELIQVKEAATKDIHGATGELEIWTGYYRISWNYC